MKKNKKKIILFTFLLLCCTFILISLLPKCFSTNKLTNSLTKFFFNLLDLLFLCDILTDGGTSSLALKDFPNILN